MTEETVTELLRLSKKAMVFLSVNCKDRDFVFQMRDIIRKADSEMKGENDEHDVH